MNNLLRPVLAAWLTSLASAAHAQPPGSETVYLESVRCVGGPFGLMLPQDLRQVRALGKLIREQVAEVERWDGYTATRKTLFFEGLELGVVEFSNDPAALMLTHAVVIGAQWSGLTPFKPGLAVQTARKLFGASANGDPGLRKVYAGDGDSVQVASAGGVVTRVTYQCFSG